MSQNPYSPPSARVDDLSAEPPRERPSQIALAIKLAVASYVLGLVTIGLSWGYYSTLQSVGALIGNQIFTVAIMVWLYYKIWVGRNWARIVLLVFTILGILMSAGVMATGMMAAAPVLIKVQMAIGTLIAFAILWLLFTAPGKEWFRPRD